MHVLTKCGAESMTKHIMASFFKKKIYKNLFSSCHAHQLHTCGKQLKRHEENATLLLYTKEFLTQNL